MKTYWLLILALVVASWPGSVRAQATTTPDLAAIDAYVAEYMRNDQVPGVAVAIVHQNAVVYSRGFGDDGYGRPVTPDTSFILGSMSKSFTALAVMQLAEQGAIALDAPARQYLPWFAVADPEASERITVRHLLNHTSGIPARAPRASVPDATMDDQVRALAGVTLNHAPGEAHEYASPNYLVLGAIIEQVSGQPFDAYVTQHIFAPLKMQHSFTSQETAIANGMAQGHRYWFGFPVAATLSYEADRMPTAALISSGNDMARYLLAHLNGGTVDGQQVVSPAGMAELHRPNAPGDGFSYAMGWRVGPVEGVPAVHHGGIVPHFRGKMVLLPDQQWGVVVLTNASTSFPLPIVPTSHRLADGIAAYLAGQALPSPGYSQTVLYVAIAIGMLLIVFNQLRDLVLLRQWRAKRATRPAARVWLEIATELIIPILMVLLLPGLLALPWNEIWRATPDMATWLWLSVCLSALSGLIKAMLALTSRQQPRPLAARPQE